MAAQGPAGMTLGASKTIGWIPTPIHDLFVDSALAVLQRLLSKQAAQATEDKTTYAAKLEQATGEGVFKYLLLINVAAIDSYVAQTRLQAQASFRLCKRVALGGFGLIAVGVGLGIYRSFVGSDAKLDTAYLASLAGVLTQFISGVFFYLHNKTLQQFNLFSDKLVATQYVAISLLANSSIIDEAKRDECRAELVKQVLGRATTPTPTSPRADA
jgi:hypothetical protein